MRRYKDTYVEEHPESNCEPVGLEVALELSRDKIEILQKQITKLKERILVLTAAVSAWEKGEADEKK